MAVVASVFAQFNHNDKTLFLVYLHRLLINKDSVAESITIN